MIALLATLSTASAIDAHVAIGASVVVHESRPATVLGARLGPLDVRTAAGFRTEDLSWRAHTTVAFDLSPVSDHDHLIGFVHSTEQLTGDLSEASWHRYGMAYAYHAPRGLLLEVSGWLPSERWGPTVGVGAQIGWVFKLRPRAIVTRHLRR